jgi:methionyl-tRNA formyltransferase
MHITLLINRDLASNVALNYLLPALSTAHELTVYYSERVGQPPSEHALATLAFFEQTLPNEILYPLFDARQQQGPLRTFEALARYLQCPMQCLNDPNSLEGLALLRAHSPDLLLTIRYGRILQQAAIDIAGLGVLNLHSGKLPNYRGVMATFQAMKAGDPELYSTVHWIENATIDTGRIVTIQGIARAPDSCYLMNVVGLYPSGCEALIQAVRALTAGAPLVASPAPRQGQYYSFPDAKALREFHDAGLRLVDHRALAHFLNNYRSLPQSQ